MSAPAEMSARELMERLRRHYIKPGETLPGGVFMPEVTHGRAGGRRADALYVGFTSTRGTALIGHELKVSRSDWLHELDQADKADRWASECHQWYLVVPSLDIARKEELPPDWGLMTVDPRTKTRMRIEVRATLHADRQPTWPTAHSIIKKLDSMRAQLVYEAREAARASAAAEVDERVRRELALRGGTANLEAELDRQRALLEQIEQAIGARITSTGWSFGDEITLEQLRTSFADWLAADRAAATAMETRAYRLRGMVENLEAAAEGARAALAVLERKQAAA